MSVDVTWPCHRCGSTDRRSNGHCKPCAQKKEGAHADKPCVKCGATERSVHGQCKACKRAYQRIASATEEGKAKKRALRRGVKSPKKRSTPEELEARRQARTGEKHRAWEKEYAKRPDVVLRKHARRYGISAFDLQGLIVAQNGKCAACGDAFRSPRETHIDHDHATGQVRGLLCKDCNLAEGFLCGSALRARKLAAYLDKHTPRLLDVSIVRRVA